jgi:hypothetical protein
MRTSAPQTALAALCERIHGSQPQVPTILRVEVPCSQSTLSSG